MSKKVDDEKKEPEGAAACERLFGHKDQQKAFLQALATGRLHHAWMLKGPEGTGKASFAWLAAKFLLSGRDPMGEESLFGPAEPVQAFDLPLDDATVYRIASEAHGDLKVIRRTPDPKDKAKEPRKLRKQIVIDQIHNLHTLFAKSAAEEGWRVAIIDCADDLNVSAANALLKILEEPPVKSIFFLVTHQPGGLLPTLRSRCRQIDFKPLSRSEMTSFVESTYPELDEGLKSRFIDLAEGCPGAMSRLQSLNADDVINRLAEVVRSLPHLNGAAVHQFVKSFTPVKAQEQRIMAIQYLDSSLAGALGYDTPASLQAMVDHLRTIFSMENLFLLREKLATMTAQHRGLNIDTGFFLIALFETLRQTAQKG